MRNTFYVILLFFAYISYCSAYDLGLKVGLNYSNASGEIEELDFKNKFGYNLGIIGIFDINQNFAVQMGFDYTTKGFQKKEPYTDRTGNFLAEYNTINNFEYADLHFNIKYSITKLLPKLNICLGSNIAYLLSAETIIETPQKDYTHDFTDTINNFDHGISIGFELEYYLFEQKFLSDIRYNLSLNALYKGGDWNWARHRLFSFSLCYIFYNK
jgi:hypothetical protein